MPIQYQLLSAQPCNRYLLTQNIKFVFCIHTVGPLLIRAVAKILEILRL